MRKAYPPQDHVPRSFARQARPLIRSTWPEGECRFAPRSRERYNSAHVAPSTAGGFGRLVSYFLSPASAAADSHARGICVADAERVSGGPRLPPRRPANTNMREENNLAATRWLGRTSRRVISEKRNDSATAYPLATPGCLVGEPPTMRALHARRRIRLDRGCCTRSAA